MLGNVPGDEALPERNPSGGGERRQDVAGDGR